MTGLTQLLQLQGALFGAATATCLVLWIGIGTQIALATGAIVYEEKLTSVAGCVCTNRSETHDTLLPDLETQETK
jgi:hypothetical protein